jgi:glycosyltransferase involved in cell wall biosynthesis
MEGIAMGKEVIASDIPPHREFVRQHVRFFKPEDERGLSEAMEAVLCSGATASYLSPSPLHDLTIEACAARFLPGLQRLLA